jgi:DNA-directed RNA polymerase subunit RPC12/RpoP
MISLVGTENHVYDCPKCLKEINNAWILKYESEGYTRYVYLCSNCGYTFKIKQNEEDAEFLKKADINNIQSKFEYK